MTGRELIKALLDGDAAEHFDLDDEVVVEDAGDHGIDYNPLVISITRQQARPTARPRTQIVFGS